LVEHIRHSIIRRLPYFYLHTRNYWALLVFFLASAWSMLPILQHPDRSIIGWLGDNVQYVYMTGWVGKALFSGASPFLDPHLNYPGELILAATDAPFLSMILVSPFSQLVNPTFSYNLIIFLSNALSGFFTYLWVVRLTKNRYAGMAAGLIFQLSPYRLAHSYGHLQMVSTQFIPVFFWSLDNALRDRLPSLKCLIGLGVSVFLLGMGGAQYYLVICLFAGVWYYLLKTLSKILDGAQSVRFLWPQGWKILLAVSIGALLSSLPYIVAYSKAVYSPFQVEDTRMWSSSLLDFFVPSRLHLLWGTAIQKLNPRPTWIEHTLYLGFPACILALVGIFPRSSQHKRQQIIWLGVIAVGLLIALGTDLHYNGNPVQNHPLWLPAYYMAHLPILNLMRVWARYTIIPIFFIAMSAGVGLSILSQHLQQTGKPPKMKILVMVVCLSLILLDFAPGRIEANTLELRPVDQWLAQQPGRFAVAFLPASVENYQAMYGSLLHNKSLPAWNHPTHLPQEFSTFAQIAEDFPESSSIQSLQDMDFKYLILHKPSYDGGYYPSWHEVEKFFESNTNLYQVAVLQDYVVLGWRK